MPTGVIINAGSIFVGGLVGGVLGQKFSEDFKRQLTLVFAICSMGMGIYAIGPMKNMPAVIFALVVGTAFGLLIHLGDWINKGAVQMQRPIAKLFPQNKTGMGQEEFILTLVTIIVLFCASGTGIYGSLDNGMTGSPAILISKSILDFFTAAIFASNLGFVVSVIAIPQFVIFTCLFFLAKFIYPLTTPTMIADFKACGGFLMIATGFRMVRIKDFPTADMIPAMVFVMPLSWVWVNVVVPML
jgi:uncharacterized membrane protein YqgA involved in biofilm formation